MGSVPVPGEDPIETSQGGGGLSFEAKANQAILQNMSEVLTDKVQQIVNKTIPMVEAYQEVVLKKTQINPK